MSKEIIKNKWISLYYGKTNLAFQCSSRSYFDGRAHLHIAIFFLSLFVSFPFGSKIEECEYPEYGFYLYPYGLSFDSLWLCWGMKKKVIHMPWEFTWYRTSKLKKDGTWKTELKKDRKEWFKTNKDHEEWEKIRWKETHAYLYVLKNGEYQWRRATIGVEEMEWRRRWLMWTTLFSKKRMSIEVSFDGEVGERTGEWKGGCTGCSYEMQENETPFHCLQRMQAARKFT